MNHHYLRNDGKCGFFWFIYEMQPFLLLFWFFSRDVMHLFCWIQLQTIGYQRCNCSNCEDSITALFQFYLAQIRLASLLRWTTSVWENKNDMTKMTNNPCSTIFIFRTFHLHCGSHLMNGPDVKDLHLHAKLLMEFISNLHFQEMEMYLRAQPNSAFFFF